MGATEASTHSLTALQEKVTEVAEHLQVPGVAVGVLIDGAAEHAFYGVTSVENPLPVNEDTLFQYGSTTKTFTATAMLRLVEQGRVDLDAPVRTYIPEFRLKDEDVARSVTVFHLFNHTAGWEGDLMEDMGPGDDALARYVERMASIEQVTPVGESVSYNNASLSVAGRVIEKVTGQTYEQAMKELIFQPLGLDHCYFFPVEIMTRRFVVGHNQAGDGPITVARPWAIPRGNNPAGGISGTVADLLAWARFHLGEGRAADGTSVLSEGILRRMQQPTVDTPGSALGDAVGIGWLLRDVEGVRLVSHGGDTIGQHSAFTMVPERGFAVASLTNCGPNGPQLNEDIVRWALAQYLGVVERDPEPVSMSEAELAEYAGIYETIAVTTTIKVRDGGLLLTPEVKPEVRAQLQEAGEEVPEESTTFRLGLLPGPGDRYIVTEGPAKGMKGFFARGAAGAVDRVHVGGRLATRVVESSPSST
ncbi:MAG TPA: serine hydrolase [Chloroflexi bacterium]|nr:serine hydrolase [Chloroflexota bacterium]